MTKKTRDFLTNTGGWFSCNGPDLLQFYINRLIKGNWKHVVSVLK